MQIIICVAKISTAQTTDKPINMSINRRHIAHSLPIHIGIGYITLIIRYKVNEFNVVKISLYIYLIATNCGHAHIELRYHDII